jgi:pimeloyl-ACP methyl ester carboxylesterase
MQPAFRSHLCLGPHGFHRIDYALWEGGDAGLPVVCVHGLTRNARDFDFLAERLRRRGPVIAANMPGRGGSDWLPAPADYSYPVYIADTASLIAAALGRAGVGQVDFIGTSMGGIIGMSLAAMPGSPIRRLVLNDVGAFIPKLALDAIANYVGRDPLFPTLEALEGELRTVHAPFGKLTDAQWRHLATHSARELPEGGFKFSYDPAIATAFRGVDMQDVDLWPVYDLIACPTLLIRGLRSYLLPATVADEMTRRGPRAKLFEVADAGHAPALMEEAQIARIEEFLALESV